METQDYDRCLFASLGAVVWEAETSALRLAYASLPDAGFLGYENEEWSEADFWLRLLHPVDCPGVLGNLRASTIHGCEMQIDHRVLTADRTVRWMHTMVRPVRDVTGTVVSLRGVMVDTTGAQRHELEQARKRAMLVHELKNPLGVVLLNADLLLQNGAQFRSFEQELLNGIVSSVRQMNRVLNDLAGGTGRAHHMSVRPEPCSAGDLVRDAADALRPVAAGRDVELLASSSERAGVRADPERILQVFGNLIGNAVRYTPPGGVIRIGAAQEGPVVRFSVEDTGAGIPPGRVDALLGLRPGSAGAGLGLPIVREIVEAHGGRLHAESRIGVGSTFSFTLPRL